MNSEKPRCCDGGAAIRSERDLNMVGSLDGRLRFLPLSLSLPHHHSVIKDAENGDTDRDSERDQRTKDSLNISCRYIKSRFGSFRISGPRNNSSGSIDHGDD